MELASRSFYPVLGFLLTIGFGLWLSRRGKPYNGLLFNVHKLIALGTVILAGMATYRLTNLFDLPASFIFLIILAVVNIIALFASGALMSANKGDYRRMKTIHHVAPFVLVFSIGLMVYWLPDL